MTDNALEAARKIVAADAGPIGPCWHPNAVLVAAALLERSETVEISASTSRFCTVASHWVTCPNCQCDEVDAGSQFCPQCGKEIKWT